MSSPSLVVGCGYLGRRVADRWVAAGRSVAAVTRRNADTLSAAGMTPVIGDVHGPASLRGLPRAGTVLYAVGFDRSAGKSMRDVYVGGLANVLDALPDADRFLYVSSTSVYGQSDGGWVDETSATEPREEAGRVVKEAEELLRSRRPDAVIARSAGQYGPGRLLRKGPLLKGEPVPADPDGWLNLIHADDAADALVFLETHGAAGETYLLADDAPATRREFYGELGRLLDAPPVVFAAPPSSAEANRRVSNRKLRGLGWEPRHPSFREGLAHAVPLG